MADGGGMEHGELHVAGVRRTYWLVRGPGAQAPLLMVLPGSGTTGKDIATTFTGLATRGPAAGVTVVFPNGWDDVWHVAEPPPGEPALDDAAFLRALACQLQGTAEPQPLVLAGISNGAGFAEHAARHGLLPLTGLFLVAGTIRESSRQVVPVPRQQAAVTIMAGTGDKMVPYGGGELHAKGLTGLKLRRRAARHGENQPALRRVVGTETVAQDWATANGVGGEPAAETLPAAPPDPPVTRLTWSGSDGPPVVLYRIEGGGHGWPGGPQYLPARVVGPIPRQLDATQILLDMVATRS